MDNAKSTADQKGWMTVQQRTILGKVNTQWNVLQILLDQARVYDPNNLRKTILTSLTDLANSAATLLPISVRQHGGGPIRGKDRSGQDSGLAEAEASSFEVETRNYYTPLQWLSEEDEQRKRAERGTANHGGGGRNHSSTMNDNKMGSEPLGMSSDTQSVDWGTDWELDDVETTQKVDSPLTAIDGKCATPLAVVGTYISTDNVDCTYGRKNCTDEQVSQSATLRQQEKSSIPDVSARSPMEVEEGDGREGVSGDGRGGGDRPDNTTPASHAALPIRSDRGESLPKFSEIVASGREAVGEMCTAVLGSGQGKGSADGGGEAESCEKTREPQIQTPGGEEGEGEDAQGGEQGGSQEVWEVGSTPSELQSDEVFGEGMEEEWEEEVVVQACKLTPFAPGKRGGRQDIGVGLGERIDRTVGELAATLGRDLHWGAGQTQRLTRAVMWRLLAKRFGGTWLESTGNGDCQFNGLALGALGCESHGPCLRTHLGRLIEAEMDWLKGKEGLLDDDERAWLSLLETDRARVGLPQQEVMGTTLGLLAAALNWEVEWIYEGRSEGGEGCFQSLRVNVAGGLTNPL